MFVKTNNNTTTNLFYGNKEIINSPILICMIDDKRILQRKLGIQMLMYSLESNWIMEQAMNNAFD